MGRATKRPRTVMILASCVARIHARRLRRRLSLQLGMKVKVAHMMQTWIQTGLGGVSQSGRYRIRRVFLSATPVDGVRRSARTLN